MHEKFKFNQVIGVGAQAEDEEIGLQSHEEESAKENHVFDID